MQNITKSYKYNSGSEWQYGYQKQIILDLDQYIQKLLDIRLLFIYPFSLIIHSSIN